MADEGGRPGFHVHSEDQTFPIEADRAAVENGCLLFFRGVEVGVRAPAPVLVAGFPAGRWDWFRRFDT